MYISYRAYNICGNHKPKIIRNYITMKNLVMEWF